MAFQSNDPLLYRIQLVDECREIIKNTDDSEYNVINHAYHVYLDYAQKKSQA